MLCYDEILEVGTDDSPCVFTVELWHSTTPQRLVFREAMDDSELGNGIEIELPGGPVVAVFVRLATAEDHDSSEDSDDI